MTIHEVWSRFAYAIGQYCNLRLDNSLHCVLACSDGGNYVYGESYVYGTVKQLLNNRI